MTNHLFTSNSDKMHLLLRSLAFIVTLTIYFEILFRVVIIPADYIPMERNLDYNIDLYSSETFNKTYHYAYGKKSNIQTVKRINNMGLHSFPTDAFLLFFFLFSG